MRLRRLEARIVAVVVVAATAISTTKAWEPFQQASGSFTGDRSTFLRTGATVAASLVALAPIEAAHAMYNDPRTGISLPSVGEMERLAVPRDDEGWALVDVPLAQQDLPLTRLDATPDALFYTEPRLVEHIDATAVRQLTNYLDSVVQNAMLRNDNPPVAILDLCASWTSHLTLPSSASSTTTSPYRVAGLGMNAVELAANPVLTDYVVQDLNTHTTLPYANHTFDLVLCQLSMDYLIYPWTICREMARVCKPGQSVHIVFSNRIFFTKAVSTWTGWDDVDHATLLASYLHACGDGTWDNIAVRDLSLRNAQGRVVGDPLYVVTAQAGAR